MKPVVFLQTKVEEKSLKDKGTYRAKVQKQRRKNRLTKVNDVISNHVASNACKCALFGGCVSVLLYMSLAGLLLAGIHDYKDGGIV